MTEKDTETSAAPAAQTQAAQTPVTSAPANSPALPTNGALTGTNTGPDRVSSPEVHFPSADSNGTVNLKSRFDLLSGIRRSTRLSAARAALNRLSYDQQAYHQQAAASLILCKRYDINFE